MTFDLWGRDYPSKFLGVMGYHYTKYGPRGYFSSWARVVQRTGLEKEKKEEEEKTKRNKYNIYAPLHGHR